jgi:hypothetical protein
VRDRRPAAGSARGPCGPCQGAASGIATGSDHLE